MLEFSIIFSDDRFTFDEFLALMDLYEIEVEENEDGVLSVRSARKKTDAPRPRPLVTNAEKKILLDYDINPDLVS